MVGRTVEGTEEYQRVATNFGKGLSAIQEELHRMRMATKAQVDSLAIQREVNGQSHGTGSAGIDVTGGHQLDLEMMMMTFDLAHPKLNHL